eukprot:TRINITY_DN3839_c0_g1_i1.p5 TRINITY_DN3839_c0_g1~~TRINITY_DN3839_c0_g1_i1.p5  ORF type:complete len:107 (-),score=34.91 TRINITY_DN3839_c0_g1_i1:203-523(-)
MTENEEQQGQQEMSFDADSSSNTSSASQAQGGACMTVTDDGLVVSNEGTDRELDVEEPPHRPLRTGFCSAVVVVSVVTGVLVLVVLVAIIAAAVIAIRLEVETTDA